jgi:hypothetical protein
MAVASLLVNVLPMMAPNPKAADTKVPDAKAEAARPAWLDRVYWTEPPARFRVIRSELWATPEQAIKDALGQAAPIAQELLALADARFGAASDVPVQAIHDHLVREAHIEKVAWTYGPMYRSYLLLELSPQRRDQLRADAEKTVVRRRLTLLSGGFGFVVTCLTTMLVYLRMDERTHGYYSGRLRIGAGLIVAAVGAGLYRLLV